MSGPAPTGVAGPTASGDANGDGVVDPADIFYAVNYLFMNGPMPYSETPKMRRVAGSEIAGSITLGTPHTVNGRVLVPVIVTADRRSAKPQALSLKLHVSGAFDSIDVRRSGDAAAFEVTRPTTDGVAYLVSLGGDASLSGVVAEIELSGVGDGARLTLDPALTTLSDRAGVNEATVSNGSLRIGGTAVRAITRPRKNE
jgi:hypothetical protein